MNHLSKVEENITKIEWKEVLKENISIGNRYWRHIGGYDEDAGRARGMTRWKCRFFTLNLRVELGIMIWAKVGDILKIIMESKWMRRSQKVHVMVSQWAQFGLYVSTLPNQQQSFLYYYWVMRTATEFQNLKYSLHSHNLNFLPALNWTNLRLDYKQCSINYETPLNKANKCSTVIKLYK